MAVRPGEPDREQRLGTGCAVSQFGAAFAWFAASAPNGLDVSQIPVLHWLAFFALLTGGQVRGNHVPCMRLQSCRVFLFGRQYNFSLVRLSDQLFHAPPEIVLRKQQEAVLCRH